MDEPTGLAPPHQTKLLPGRKKHYLVVLERPLFLDEGGLMPG